MVSRHLDGKARVAVALALAKTIAEQKVVLPHARGDAHGAITEEEVGHGAGRRLPPDVAELVSVDNAVCAPGRHSIEHGVTIDGRSARPVRLSPDPWLCRLARAEHPVRTRRFPLLPVGRGSHIGGRRGHSRAALVGFGHGRQPRLGRTHLDSLEATCLLLHSAADPMTFEAWDAAPTGNLRDFPSYKQPAPSEAVGAAVAAITPNRGGVAGRALAPVGRPAVLTHSRDRPSGAGSVESNRAEPGRDFDLEIQQLLVAYSTAIDRRQFDDLDAVFTPDAYIDYRAMGGVDRHYPG